MENSISATHQLIIRHHDLKKESYYYGNFEKLLDLAQFTSSLFINCFDFSRPQTSLKAFIETDSYIDIFNEGEIELSKLECAPFNPNQFA